MVLEVVEVEWEEVWWEEVEEDTDQDLGVAVATINGEVDGDTMQDHLDHGDILLGTEGVGVAVGEMAHTVAVEKRKGFEVEEEEEEVTRINDYVLISYIIQYLYHIDNFLLNTYTNIVERPTHQWLEHIFE